MDGRRGAPHNAARGGLPRAKTRLLEHGTSSVKPAAFPNAAHGDLPKAGTTLLDRRVLSGRPEVLHSVAHGDLPIAATGLLDHSILGGRPEALHNAAHGGLPRTETALLDHNTPPMTAQPRRRRCESSGTKLLFVYYPRSRRSRRQLRRVPSRLFLHPCKRNSSAFRFDCVGATRFCGISSSAQQSRLVGQMKLSEYTTR